MIEDFFKFESRRIVSLVACCMIFSVCAFADLPDDNRKKYVNKFLEDNMDTTKIDNLNRIYTGRAVGDVITSKDADLTGLPVYNNNKLEDDITLNIENGFSTKGATAGINMSVNSGKLQEVDGLKVNVKGGDYKGEFRGVRLWTATETNLSNTTVNMNNVKLGNKTELIRVQDSESKDYSGAITIDNLKANISNVKSNYSAGIKKESAIYGINAHSISGDVNVDNVDMEIEKSEVVGNITGVMAGKYDETNSAPLEDPKKSATTGNVDAKNIKLTLKDVNVSGFSSGNVKGIEVDSKGGSAKAQAELDISSSSQIKDSVAGAYAGNTSVGLHNITQNSVPNSTASSLSATGNVTIDDSKVGKDVFGALALGKNDATSVGNVEIKNGSTVGGNIYSAFTNSVDKDAVAKGSVLISDGSTVGGDIYGGYAKSTNGDATSAGSIKIDFSNNDEKEFSKDIYASYAQSTAGSATSQSGTLELKNVDIVGDGELIGSYATSSGDNSSLGGYVKLDNSTSQRDIYGAKALSQSGTATAEGIVEITNGSKISGEKLYGAYADANIKKTVGGDADAKGSIKIEGADLDQEFKAAYANAKGSAKAQGDVYVKDSTLNGAQKFVEAKAVDGDAVVNANIIFEDSKILNSSSNKNSYGVSATSSKGSSLASGQISLKNTNIDGRFYATHAASSSESANSAIRDVLVSLEKSSVEENLYGGYLEHRGGIGEASNIDLILSDSKVGGSTIGFLNSSSSDKYINPISVDKVNIILKEGSEVGALVGARVFSHSGDSVVKNVSVLLDEESKVDGNLYGVHASSATASTDAQADIFLNNGSEVKGDLFGAVADYYVDSKGVEYPIENKDAKASASVNLNTKSRVGSLTGSKAISAKGDATSNAYVVIEDSRVDGNIYGAYAQSNEGLADATGVVTLENGASVAQDKDIFGVFVENSKDIKAVGLVNLDSVELQGNSVAGVLARSNSQVGQIDITGEANINNSKLTGSKDGVIGAYFGSFSQHEDIKILGNVNVQGNSVVENIRGTYVILDKDSKTVNTESNIFIGDRSTISGQVIGGYINMSELNNDIDYHSKNSVTIFGDVNFDEKSEIWGQIYNKEDNSNLNLNYDAMDNNTLKFQAKPITIAKLGNFDSYEFTINEFNSHLIHNGADDSQNGIITVTDVFKNDIEPNTGKAATVKITGIDGNLVNPDDRIILIDLRGADLVGGNENFDVTDLFENVGKGEADKIKVGFIRKAFVTYDVEQKVINDDCSGDECSVEDTYGYTVVAKIKKKEPEFCELNPTHEDCVDPVEPPKPPVEPEFCELNPTHPSCDEGEWEVDEDELARLSSIYQARLSNLAAINQGGNLIIDSVVRTLEPTKLGDIIPFGVTEGGKGKYKNDGEFTNKYWNFVVGAGYSFEESVVGWFFEYGKGKYNSHNSFADGNVKGSGKNRYYGVGVLGKKYFGDVYLDSSVRYGTTKVDYKTNDIVSGTGAAANYDNRQSYLGAHVGVGHKLEVENSTFNTSVKGIYTTIGKDSKTIAGEKFKFDRVNSTRLRVAEDYTLDVTKNVGLKAGVAYEYEFDGKAKGKVDGVNIKAPSLKGSTYVGSAGVILHPFNGGDKNKAIEFGGKGYLGKQKGASGNVQFTYNF